MLNTHKEPDSGVNSQRTAWHRVYSDRPRPGFPITPLGKVALYRDTGSADPGSAAIFGSVSVSEIHILCIALAKDTFSLY